VSRPRIRTVKPEIWQDEKVGDLSHSARLLFLGLITMADDEGRLRALSSLILGHVFPYDDVPPARLQRWIGELVNAQQILPYKADDKPYIAIRNWRRHQKPSRPTLSSLPEPPDEAVVRENALPDHRLFSEDSLNQHGKITEDSLPRAQARGSRSVPDPEELPEDLNPQLEAAVRSSFSILQRTAEARGAKAVSLLAVARAVEGYPGKDHVAVAGSVEHWLIHGNGSRRPARDVVQRFRNFLADSPDAEVRVIRTPASKRNPYDAVMERAS
jgi:hypothetical protein